MGKNSLGNEVLTTNVPQFLITLLLLSVDIGNFDLQLHLSDESDDYIFS